MKTRNSEVEILLPFYYEKPRNQLLKWVGNKYRYATEICNQFPTTYNKFVEPFVGTAAVLATIAPERGIAGDTLLPLIDMWKTIQCEPDGIIEHYWQVINAFRNNRESVYQEVRDRYNHSPNPFDLVVICRTCYGGVIRFTKEGKISTPLGPHQPIKPQDFAKRVLEWRNRIKSTVFYHQSFGETMSMVEKGDIVYCDPPYLDSQKILYGAQAFDFSSLVIQIERCKRIGAKVALSIDGRKKSGRKEIFVPIPDGLFEREIFLSCGSSMLRRFQNGGQTMLDENVYERLLLTW